MNASSDSFQTKSSWVYAELRKDITGGLYKPGEHLIRRNFVKKYKVSLSIINEAFARLSADGLVESKEMYGTRVMSATDADIRNDFALREAIERHVARLLAESATDEALETLLSDACSVDAWMSDVHHDETQGGTLHLEFHLKMARATGFASLEESLKRTGIRGLMTSRWLQGQRFPHPPNFHKKLVTTLMKRDPHLADSAMKDHLHYGAKRNRPEK